MDDNWHQQTCEACIYRVDTKCRRFPPQGTNGYPIVMHRNSFMDDATPVGYAPACAEFNYDETK